MLGDSKILLSKARFMVILSWITFLALLGHGLGTLGHSFNFSEPQVFYMSGGDYLPQRK